MKKQLSILFICCFCSFYGQAQMGINTDASIPDNSAMLDIKSIDKGVLIPRMTSAQRNAINNPATGLLVFDIDSKAFWFFGEDNWVPLQQDQDANPSNEIQNLNDVLLQGNNAGGQNVTNLGAVSANSFSGDGSGLTNLNVTGDNLGNHTATANFKTNNKWLSNDGGNEGIYIDDTGKVGLGLNTPTVELEVDAVAPRIRLTDNEVNSGDAPNNVLGSLSWWTRDATNGGHAPSAEIEVVSHDYTNAPDSRMQFKTGENGTMSTRMVIDPFGKVGIGMTEPSATLDINGNLRIRGGSPTEGAILRSSGTDGTAEWVAPNERIAKVEQGINPVNFPPSTGFHNIITTPPLNVKPGDLITIHAMGEGNVTTGEGVDLVSVRVRVQGCETAFISGPAVFSPDDASNHTRQSPFPVVGWHTANCTGTLTFSYQAAAYGDDTGVIDDAVLIAIKQ